jgi:tetratricopeptide (TPR) repeat protein
MKRGLILLAVLAMGGAFVGHAAAGIIDPAGFQELSKEEADTYKAWYDARTGDPAKAMELAKAYLEKFPKGQYAEYLRTKWIPATRAKLFNAAVIAKNTNEMIRLVREAMAANDPNTLDYQYLLAFSIRQNELFASPPNYSHANEAAEFSRKIIEAVEAGKAPTSAVPKEQWNPKAALSWLYQNLAVIEANNKNREKALEYYKKASEFDPSNWFNHLACGSLHREKYGMAVEKFQALPETDRQNPDANPDAKAKLDEVNKEADNVIECWARYMALTANNNQVAAQRQQVEKALVELYKYRHPDDPDGLQKLIEQYKANPHSAPGTAQR